MRGSGTNCQNTDRRVLQTELVASCEEGVGKVGGGGGGGGGGRQSDSLVRNFAHPLVTQVPAVHYNQYTLWQGRQRHKRSGRSALRKAVPGGRSACWQRREAPICPRKARKKFSHVFLAMRKRSRSIKMAVLGKKRPWLLWSFNGRPTTRTRNSRVCI